MASFRRDHIEMQKQMQRRGVCVGDCVTRKRTPAHCGGWCRPPVDPQSSSSVLGSAMLPLAAALLFAAVAVSQTTVQQTSVTQTPGPPVPDPRACPPDKLTTYRVVLHTFWTREMFPKHYPEWRPPAQWSKLIGESMSQNIS